MLNKAVPKAIKKSKEYSELPGAYFLNKKEELPWLLIFPRAEQKRI
jgi:hypothetical protein